MKIGLTSWILTSFLYLTQCYELIDVDLKSMENGLSHNTDKYEMVKNNMLILRRGQPFTIKVHLAEPFSSTDSITTVASLKNEYHGMFLERNTWENKVLNTNEKSFDLEIMIPPREAVGKWHVLVRSVEPDAKPLNFEVIVYVIFNPWFKSDSVYFNQTLYLHEYVLNDAGYVFMERRFPKPWYYAQFTRKAFLATMFLLDKFVYSKLEYSEAYPVDKQSVTIRKDPVLLTRGLSAFVNSNDDWGMLVGKWDQPYTPYTAPTEWLGSLEILEKYVTERYPVRFSQCWVFAAVLTTICRGIGIASRPVTNYNSAHDKDQTLSMDIVRFFNPMTGFREIMWQDLTWNYHVWTEVWMDREDLPPGYGGWQAIDGTPQEKTSGFYRIGPASLRAVKEGRVDFNYETAYVYSEVNADFVEWFMDNQIKTVVYVKIAHIGSSVVTKSSYYNPFGYEDVTDSYKYREGTPEERTFYNKALKLLGLEKNYLDSMLQGRELINNLLIKSQLCKQKSDNSTCEEPLIGQNSYIKLTFESEHAPINITVNIRIATIDYTGYFSDIVKEDRNVAINVGPNKTQEHTIPLDADNYIPKLDECEVLQAEVSSQSASIRISWIEGTNIISFKKPRMTMKIPENIKDNTTFLLTMQFQNPMNRNLTDCKVRFTGQGLDKTFTIPVDDFEPLERRDLRYEVITRGTGQRRLISLLRCKQIRHVYGEVEYDVK